MNSVIYGTDLRRQVYQKHIKNLSGVLLRT